MLPERDTVGDVYTSPNFSKIKVGVKTLEDAVYDIGSYKRVNRAYGDKEEVLKAINNLDYCRMREISNFFYRTSGIYNRLCRYMAYFYRYDWVVTPYVKSDAVKPEAIKDSFHKVLKVFDDFQIKKFFGEVALKVLRNGCYYGYLIHEGDKILVQELPPSYCRTRFFGPNNMPIVEFNMRYFITKFPDSSQRERILKLFPKEFQRGFELYKTGKLVGDFPEDTAGWYMLDPEFAFKFNINGEDFPPFISVIPSIIDLDEAQGLDRKKMQQQLLKIIIQKMPLDKNGDLVFDVDEAQQLHNNVVQMLGRAIGVDVLTTFADVDVADMADKKTNTTADDLAKVERTVYNEAGVSQMQFNTDGNIALEKSILNDEAAMYNLILQFEQFLNNLLKPYNKASKKFYFRAQILTTTIYNFKDMAKLYKEQTQLGYSKMLPQIALGQSQSSILATADFENKILELVNVFIPPMQSSVMNAEALQQVKGGGNSSNAAKTEDKQAGRPEKADDEKTEKTIQNRESAN